MTKATEEKVVYRTEPISFPFGVRGDDSDLVEKIRDLAHPMLVVEIEGKSMVGVCRIIAELNAELRPMGYGPAIGELIPFPDEVDRCECCGQPVEEAH